jgi:acyl dehydratase
MREFESAAELRALIGQEIAVSDWVLVDQDRVNLFADATGDHQWIHVDPERAAKGPFGAPVAHGYLTLSLLPMLMQQAVTMKHTKMGVNYGLNKVRFPSPVKVGSRVRARFALVAMEALEPMAGIPGDQMTYQVTIECEGATKPVCVAETVSRRYGN